MRQRIWIASVTILVTLLLAGSAFAGGWGPYFSWGREKPSVGIDEYEGIPLNIEGDARLDHLTFGVMYDSAPAQDRLLGYRATLGFDIATGTKIEDIKVGSIPIPLPITEIDLDQSSKYGFSTNHTLTFGIIRNNRLKWWAGPSIGMAFNYYDIDTLFGIQAPDGRAAHLSIGGGGETGVNIHLGPGMTLCVGGGIHLRAFGLGFDSDGLGSFFWGNGPLFFIKTSLLFRTGPDRFVDPAE